MALTDKTRLLLTEKLRFSEEQIQRLESNPELEQETKNLLDIIKLSPEKKEIRQYARVQFKRIRETLSETQPIEFSFLRQARSRYYTFKRVI